MHHIGAILPIPHLLRQLSDNAATRLRTLPRSSQVLMRTPSTWDEHSPNTPIHISPRKESKSKPPTIIHRLANRISPHSERLFPYHTAPWERQHPWSDRLSTQVPRPGRSSNEERSAYLRMARRRIASLEANARAITIYTDGSRKRVHGHKRTGAGLVAFSYGHEIHAAHIPLGRRAGVYDAEMWALAAGAAFANQHLSQHPHITTI
ncbi:hypothetical protein FB107DRAFT_195916, partial [Schizophyllum commune]